MAAVSMVVAPTQKRAEDMPDSTYESSLSTLARNVLQDKAPRLFEYEIGFQLMEKSDDGDKAVGVFGFQVGPETLYAPVIFNNGAVKGTELLWAKSLGQFIPMAEGWVNAYMRRRPTSVGSPITRERSREGVGYPDLIPIIRSPFKMAAFQKGAKEAYAAMRAAAGDAFDDLARIDLTRVSQRSPKFATTLTSWLGHYPSYKRAYDQFYGAMPPMQPAPSPALTAPPVQMAPPAVAPPVGGQLASALAMGMPQGSTPQPSPVLGLNDPQTPTKENAADAMAKAAAYGTVAVVTVAQVVGRQTPLTPRQREELVTNNYSINDDRTEASMVVPVAHNLHLSNPKCTGRYPVLQPNGEFAERLVVFLRDRKADRRVLVLDVSAGGEVRAYGRCEPSEVWVNEGSDNAGMSSCHEIDTILSGLPEVGPKTPNYGSKYLVVGPDGIGYGPFRVCQDLSSEDGPVTMGVDHTWCDEVGHDNTSSGKNDMLWYSGKANPYWGYGTKRERMPSRRTGGRYDGLLVLTGKPGRTLLRDRDDILVPSNSKMITLEEGTDEEKIPADDRDRNGITLGRPEDLTALVSRKSARLVVDRQYADYLIAGRKFAGKAEAVKELVEGWDLREADALHLLKTADTRPADVFVVPTERVTALAEKIAAGPPDSYGIGNSINAPDFPEMPGEYVEQTLSGSVPANTPYDVRLPIDPALLDQNRTKMVNDFYAPPENSTIMQAAQAAEKGVKEVFDTGSFSTLMRRHGDDVLIDDNLPDLMKALGALGTLLFNLYYSDEEFADRFGKNDLIELEGILRSAFKSVGETLLYLKQKSVRAFPGDYGVDFSGSAPNS